jgi:hypothetical protein
MTSWKSLVVTNNTYGHGWRDLQFSGDLLRANPELKWRCQEVSVCVCVCVCVCLSVCLSVFYDPE